MLGIISKKDYSVLSEFLKQRNQITHGNLETIQNKELVDNTFDICKRIFNEIKSDYLNNESFNYVSFLSSLNEKELSVEIDNILSETIHEIIDDESIISLMATTNAFGWSVDEYEIENIEIDDECVVEFSFAASGEHDDEKMYYGDKITGKGIAKITIEKNVNFDIVDAEIYDENI